MKKLRTSKYIVLGYILLWQAAFFPTATYAEDEEYTAIVEKKYPGQHKLTYYYTELSSRLNQPAKAVVGDKVFIVDPGVRPPLVNGVFLLEHSEVNKGEDVLDIGTGTGLHAIFAAENANHIVATDIDPRSIENAKKNAELNGVSNKIDFRVGDLLAPLKDDEKFDVIYFNIAYHFYENLPQPWELHERLFANIRKHMKPNARLYYQAGFIKYIPYVQDMVSRNGLYIMRMDMQRLTFYGYEPITMLIQE